MSPKMHYAARMELLHNLNLPVPRVPLRSTLGYKYVAPLELKARAQRSKATRLSFLKTRESIPTAVELAKAIRLVLSIRVIQLLFRFRQQRNSCACIFIMP